ncbi:MAG TPA: helix-turn-helix transcriptional regulator [Candidatus Binatia bacterium]|jgi:DNA-binding CsgD family transcriptional regulator
MAVEEKPLLLEPDSLKPLGLTQRETEVLAWVAEGKSNSDIACILAIRSVTVKKHLEHIFQKIGVETRTAAVAFALRAIRQSTRIASFLPLVCCVDDLFETLAVALDLIVL